MTFTQFPLLLAKTYLPAVRAAKCLENLVFLILIFSHTISTVKEKFSDQRSRGQYMTQLLLLGKFEYTGGPIFKVVLEC